MTVRSIVQHGRGARRFVFVSFGSHGDLQPTLLLARALDDRAHDVAVVGPPDFSESALRLGVRYVGAGADMRRLMAQERESIKGSPIALSRGIRRILSEELGKIIPVLDDLITGGSVVVASGAAFGAWAFATARKCRYVYMALLPQLYPKSGLPLVFTRGLGLSPWLNRLLFRGQSAAMTRFVAPVLAPLYARLGLPALRDAWSDTLGHDSFLACDPVLAGPLPPELPLCLGSVLSVESPPLPGDLESFLAQGPTPVFVGFGSMPDETPEQSTHAIVAAARFAGTRLVLSSGWANLHAVSSGDVCVVGEVPYSSLFRRVRAAVHHGGAGTTARAAFSGIPQLVVPHMMDQYFWASRVHALGIGPRPLPRAKLNARTLAERLSALVSGDGYAARAREVASQMIPDALDRILRFVDP